MLIDQCLFGYEDGHRLLASSMHLGDETSTLTEMSDLAPGTVFSRSDGYWTGVPAPKIGRYALMRTWPAPEMPRPGCVWTHALLIEPSLFELVRDLTAFTRLANRPNGLSDRDRYRASLNFAPAAVSDSSLSSVMSSRIVRALLSALYSSDINTVEVAAPGDADSALFAVWSQQWPRLRRNFRFQTAVTREPRTSSAAPLDIAFRLESGDPTIEAAADTDWIEAAATDLKGSFGGELRSFLWRYGNDVRRQRGSFRPLVEVKVLHDVGPDNAAPRLLQLVAESFNDLNDATRLKQDAVDGLVVPRAQLEILWFVLAHGGEKVLPLPSAAGVERLTLLWPERSQDLLQLAERTADADTSLAKAIFDTVTGAVPIDEFWKLTSEYPRVRERMVTSRPDLLASNAVQQLDNTALAQLLELVPPGAPIGADVVPRLLSRDDVRLAEVAIDRFPMIVALEVISAADSQTSAVGRAWLICLVRRPALLLDPKVTSRVSRSTLLFDLAEALGWLSPPVVSAGAKPWIAALAGIKNDLPDDKRETMETFFVALALRAGGEGGRMLLEKFFESLHGQILNSRLTWRARDILDPCLPEVGWLRSWDFALRLRLAVAIAYVSNNYPAESYSSLARSRNVRAMLADAASQVVGGAPFAQATSDGANY